LIKSWTEALLENEIRKYKSEIDIIWEKIRDDNFPRIIDGNPRGNIKGNLQRALHKLLKLYTKISYKTISVYEYSNVVEGFVWCYVLLGSYRRAEEEIDDLVNIGELPAQLLLLKGVLRLVTSDIYSALRFITFAEQKAVLDIASKMQNIDEDTIFSNPLSLDGKSILTCADAISKLIKTYADTDLQVWIPKKSWKNELFPFNSSWDIRLLMLGRFVWYFMTRKEVLKRRKFVLLNRNRKGIQDIPAPRSNGEAIQTFGKRALGLINRNEGVSHGSLVILHKDSLNQSEKRQSVVQGLNTEKGLPAMAGKTTHVSEVRDSDRMIAVKEYLDTAGQLSKKEYSLKSKSKSNKTPTIPHYSKIYAEAIKKLQVTIPDFEMLQEVSGISSKKWSGLIKDPAVLKNIKDELEMRARSYKFSKKPETKVFWKIASAQIDKFVDEFLMRNNQRKETNFHDNQRAENVHQTVTLDDPEMRDEMESDVNKTFAQKKGKKRSQ